MDEIRYRLMGAMLRQREAEAGPVLSQELPGFYALAGDFLTRHLVPGAVGVIAERAENGGVVITALGSNAGPYVAALETNGFFETISEVQVGVVNEEGGMAVYHTLNSLMKVEW